MGDHDIGFQVGDWYPLIGDLESIQVIVMPRAGHVPHHKYPDHVANISLLSSMDGSNIVSLFFIIELKFSIQFFL